MFPFAPGFPGLPTLPQWPSMRIDVPIMIRGVQLLVCVERKGPRIYASVSIPTRWGLVELCVGVDEAPIRAALERAIAGQLGRQASAFFAMGNPAALAALAQAPPPDPAQIAQSVLGLASDVALPDLANQALAALASYGDAVGGAMPGPASVGDYAATFEGRGYGYGLPPPFRNRQLY